MQFDMKRVQSVSFSKEEVDLLNKAKDIIEKVSGKTLSPNKLLKSFTMINAEEANNIGGEHV